MKTILAILCIFVSYPLLHGKESAPRPLHLVISKVGNSMVSYMKGEDIRFTLMAEIEGYLNFNLRGEFKNATIKKASVIAPDRKRYDLVAAKSEVFPDGEGNFTRLLRPSLGERQADFSIGHWDVTILFEVDGIAYSHNCKYDITWRQEDEGIWGGSLWANDSPKAEQDGADQPATKPADKRPVKDQPSPPTSKDAPR